jgi:hypothetical protein
MHVEAGGSDLAVIHGGLERAVLPAHGVAVLVDVIEQAVAAPPAGDEIGVESRYAGGGRVPVGDPACSVDYVEPFGHGAEHVVAEVRGAIGSTIWRIARYARLRWHLRNLKGRTAWVGGPWGMGDIGD